MRTRMIHTKIWKDDYFADLNRADKLLYLYLLTNDKANISGIYEVSIREITFDTGLTETETKESINRLQEDNKIIYEDGWLSITNYEKYNPYTGSKNDVARESELKYCPKAFLDRVLIGYPYPMDTSTNTNTISNTNTKDKKEAHKKYLKSDEAKEYFYTKFPYLTRKDIDIELEKMIGWLEANGKTKKNYKAFANTWLLNMKGKVAQIKDPTHIPFIPKRDSDFTDLGAEILNKYQRGINEHA